MNRSLRQDDYGNPSLWMLLLLAIGTIAMACGLAWVVWLLIEAAFPPVLAMDEAMAQSTMYGSYGGGGSGPWSQLLSQVLPALGTLLIMAIPGIAAIAVTIVHVTFWRRDNRAMGNAPFNHEDIRDKVYFWGRVWGVGCVAVMQGTVEYLLRYQMPWVQRGCMVIIALFVTGFAARLTFDIIRGHAAAKVEAGKNGWWRRVYQYLTVRHPKPGEADDDTFYIAQGALEDPTEPK